MAAQSHFVGELFKRQPLGLSLVLFGGIAFAYVAFTFEPGVVSRLLIRVGVIVMFLAWGVGGPMTIRAASRIRAEQRFRDSQRTGQPWE